MDIKHTDKISNGFFFLNLERLRIFISDIKKHVKITFTLINPVAKFYN